MIKRAQALHNAGHHVPVSAAERKKAQPIVDAVPEEDDKSDCSKTPLQVHHQKRRGAAGVEQKKTRKLSDGGQLEIESNRKNNKSEARQQDVAKAKKDGKVKSITVEPPVEAGAAASEPAPKWMSYFDNKEFEQAVIQSTLKKEDVDHQEDGTEDPEDESDSEPSCDNFGEDVLVRKFEVAMEDEERRVQSELAHKHLETREKATTR